VEVEREVDGGDEEGEGDCLRGSRHSRYDVPRFCVLANAVGREYVINCAGVALLS